VQREREHGERNLLLYHFGSHSRAAAAAAAIGAKEGGLSLLCFLCFVSRCFLVLAVVVRVAVLPWLSFVLAGGSVQSTLAHTGEYREYVSKYLPGLTSSGAHEKSSTVGRWSRRKLKSVSWMEKRLVVGYSWVTFRSCG